MDPVIERTAFVPDDGHFLFWKPGLVVSEEAYPWQLDPGSNLVLNVHMKPSGKSEAVRPSVGLYFTDHKPQKFPLLIQLEHDGALNIPTWGAGLHGRRRFQASGQCRRARGISACALSGACS